MHPEPSQGGPDPHYGGGRAPRSKGGMLLPALLVAGSLGGIGAIMAGLLTYLSPTAEEEIYGPPAPQAGSTIEVQDVPQPGEQGASEQQPQQQQPPEQQQPGQQQPGQQDTGGVSPTSVGPGGPDAPLTAAAATAPPPLPVVKPPEPLKSVGVKPYRIAIPKIGLLAPLMALGVDAKKEVQTPPLSKPNQAGWYRHGPVPGQQGPSVVLGHVNTRSGPAVFNRLKEVRRGDKIKVSRSDRTIVEFTVDGVEQVSKKAFPSKRVYGNTGEATLRLITCGGVYNRQTHHYTDNIIIYATLSKTRRA
ncbi:class F sortase [Streptosporangium sp. NPDC000396]|uniref:class F sortase n=1 Tax=Streptosporangium sp. NPDC000396 TaxID=3366185 RepID=UPI003692BB51